MGIAERGKGSHDDVGIFLFMPTSEFYLRTRTSIRGYVRLSFGPLVCPGSKSGKTSVLDTRRVYEFWDG